LARKSLQLHFHVNAYQIKPEEEPQANLAAQSQGHAAPEMNHDRYVHLVALSGKQHREFHVTVTPRPSETPAATVARLAAALRGRQASIVRQEIFGAATAEPETMRALGETLEPICWPVLWAEVAGTNGSPLAGIHTLAVAGTAVKSIEVEGRVVGRAFADGGARHVVLGNLRPDDVAQP
jgi:hypothetical protein